MIPTPTPLSAPSAMCKTAAPAIIWANLIQSATLHRFLEYVVGLERSLKVTHGRKLRLDETVVATHIHHLTDSTLLYDSVRVFSRMVGYAKPAMHKVTVLACSAFRDRTRSAKRRMKRFTAAARQRGV
jgi:transposase, IS5 family